MSKEKIDLRAYKNAPEFKQEEIQRREAHLLQIGFKPETVEELKKTRPELVDPVQVDSVMDTLQTLVYKGKSFSDPKKLVERDLLLLNSDSSKFADNLQHLEQMGFTDPIALVTKEPSLLYANPETLKQNFTTLQTLVYNGKSFSDPKKMVESSLWLLTSDSSKFEDNLQHLEQLGFTDPVALVTRVPSLLYANPETLKEKFTTLQTLVYKGKSFLDPKKLVESSPMLLNSDSSKFADRLRHLEQLGFTDPVALVTKSPSLLASNPETLKQKLVELKKMGFTDPTALVETNPAVLDKKSQSLQHRVRLLGKILRLYELPFQENTLMERVSPLFNSKLDKVMVLARLLREYQVTSETLNEAIISELLFFNLEDVLVTLSEKPVGEDIQGLLRRIRKLRKQKLDAPFKREWIESSLEDSKIKQRYLTGYPKKAEKGSTVAEAAEAAEAAEDEIGN